MMKKTVRSSMILFFFVLIYVSMLSTSKVKAAKEYKYTESDSYVMYSNGTVGYYVKDQALYKYDCKKRKAKKLKKMPGGKYYQDAYSVSAVYAGNVYITRSDGNKWSLRTFIYRIKNKKLSDSKQNCEIKQHHGKYAITWDEYMSDVSPNSVSLYKIGSFGMKKVKTLTKKGYQVFFVGNKIYYTHYPSSPDMSKMALYRCSYSGRGKKKMAVCKDDRGNSLVMIKKTTDKYCDIEMSGGVYRYTFASKKLRKIKSSR